MVSFQASWQNKSPTDSCTPRMIGRGKILATLSSRPENAEHNENSTHEQGPGRDLVGTKTLCDGDGPECLQRLYRHRQPVKQSCSHIEQSGRQKNGGCGQAVLDDERHRDGDEHPQIRDRTGKLGPIEPQSLRV